MGCSLTLATSILNNVELCYADLGCSLTLTTSILNNVELCYADYLIDVLRGTRFLTRREARSIAGTLRKHCVHIFEPPGMRDGLMAAVQDGFRYRDSLVHKDPKDPIGGVSSRDTAAAAAATTATGRPKRLKDAYLVNKRKFYSAATDEELQFGLYLESSTDELDLDKIIESCSQDDMHRILQCRIR